ncbi:MAG: glutamine amidotransferase-related protein, partial [Psychrobacter celer]
IRSDDSDLGGTMRLGAQQAELVSGSKLAQIYGTKNITERHRHRYEMNNRYIEPLEQAGMSISGYSAKQHLVESVEIADHPWFIAVQFHPEFTSSPRGGHPLFNSFVKAAKNYSETK